MATPKILKEIKKLITQYGHCAEAEQEDWRGSSGAPYYVRIETRYGKEEEAEELARLLNILLTGAYAKSF